MADKKLHEDIETLKKLNAEDFIGALASMEINGTSFDRIKEIMKEYSKANMISYDRLLAEYNEDAVIEPNNFNETDNKLTITFDKDSYALDEVEELCHKLWNKDIYPVGEAYVQMDGTCLALWFSLHSGLVYIIDLVVDCKKLAKGETITVEGRQPTEDEMEIIRREDWNIED